MSSFWNKHNLFYRICASALTVLHIITFVPIKDALAFTASSASYKLSSGALSEGGRDRSATSAKLWQDVLVDPVDPRASRIRIRTSSGIKALAKLN